MDKEAEIERLKKELSNLKAISALLEADKDLGESSSNNDSVNVDISTQLKYGFFFFFCFFLLFFSSV